MWIFCYWVASFCMVVVVSRNMVSEGVILRKTTLDMDVFPLLIIVLVIILTMRGVDRTVSSP